MNATDSCTKGQSSFQSFMAFETLLNVRSTNTWIEMHLMDGYATLGSPAGVDCRVKIEHLESSTCAAQRSGKIS